MSTLTLDAQAIASLSLQTDSSPDVQLGQTEHRINLIKSWDITVGEHILELGCGQGDCTAALATAVGEEGKVVAVDPASLNYGEPFTLGQAQNHLVQSSVGSRISFVQANPVDFLEKDATYTSAVLAHCIYYFASPGLFLSTLKALKGHTKRICVAEYALSSTRPEGHAHVLAAIALATLDRFKPEGTSSGNIRSLLTPSQIKAIAEEAGLRLVKESVMAAPDKMFDGKWEVGSVSSKSYSEEIGILAKDGRERAILQGLQDAVKASGAQYKGNVKTMDVWSGVFEV